MIFSVPQFIDIEDKIVGPLTAKQLGWLAIGGVILMILYAFLDQMAFYIALVIVGSIFCALAFYRPYNQPLISLLTSSITFIAKPKMYIWRRDEMNNPKISKKIVATEQVQHTHKKLDRTQLSELSKILDTRK